MRKFFHDSRNAWASAFAALFLASAAACAHADSPWGHIPVARDGFAGPFAAQVWLADMSTRLAAFVPDQRFRIRLLEDVRYAALREGLRPRIVLAVIEVESAFNPYAISSSGALGLMQVMPFWTQRLPYPQRNLFRVRTNLLYGCHILRHYLNRHRGNLFAALAAYNGSNGLPYYPDRVYAALHARWFHQ